MWAYSCFWVMKKVLRIFPVFTFSTDCFPGSNWKMWSCTGSRKWKIKIGTSPVNREFKQKLQINPIALSEFWGVASRVPSLQATLPPSLPSDIFGNFRYELSDPLLVFQKYYCVTPPQIIFANLRRLLQNFAFWKILICSNCKTKRYFKHFFKLTIWLLSCRYYFFLCKQKLKDGKWRTIP